MGHVSRELARWWFKLQEVELDIFHPLEVKHHAANALWRLETYGVDSSALEEHIHILVIEDANAPLIPTYCVCKARD